VALSGHHVQQPEVDERHLLHGPDITVVGMITVIAHYRARPETADEVRALLARHSRTSAAEAGCIQFLAHQDSEDPARFALYETYEDDAAFAAHRRTTHFRVNIEQRLVPMLVERHWRVYGAPLA
jgi:quinol monooxygenase YgiN